MKDQYLINEGLRYLFFLRFFGSIAVSMLTTFFVASLLPNQSTFLLLTEILVFTFIFLRLSKLLSRRKVNIYMNKDSLDLHFQSKLFVKESKEEIKWNTIKSYKFQLEQFFTVFEITFHNGKKIKIFHDVSDLGQDDFGVFEDDFKSIVSNLNLSMPDEQGIIQKPTIYETKSGLVAALIIAALLIIFPVVLWIRGSTYNIGFLVMLYAGGLFYIFMVYRFRSKRQ